jgi:hypothetical protein
MRPKRHVPLIIGLAALALAVYLAVGIGAFWGILGAALLAMFAIPSIKTALFASDREVRELTGEAQITEETKQKYEDRA